jgi:hypothetical protein
MRGQRCRRVATVAFDGTGAGDLQVRVALVVAEQDVESRVQRLDEVVLEQQRLGLGAHHRGLQPRDAATICPMRVPPWSLWK